MPSRELEPVPDCITKLLGHEISRETWAAAGEFAATAAPMTDRERERLRLIFRKNLKEK